MSIVLQHPFGTSATSIRSLNCDDLPDVNVWPLRISKPRRNLPDVKTRSSRISKPRRKRVELPAVTEISQDSDTENAQEQPQTWWRCEACTFLNNVLLPCCEVCTVKRGQAGVMHAQAAVEHTSKALLIGSTPWLDWPALPGTIHGPAESWIDCDVSSVASSWLDIGLASEQIADADEAGIVLISDFNTYEHASKPTAPLWSAVVGSAPASVAHSVVAVTPPLSRKVADRTCTTPLDENERDIDLDELDARRMIGTMRHRVKKRR